MTTATATKTSTYHITIPFGTTLEGTIKAPAGLSRDEVIKLITWEATVDFDYCESFTEARDSAMFAVETNAADVDIEEETND